MIKERLFKPFGALVTKWRRNAFFVAHAKLTAAYALTTAILLGIFSYSLHISLLGKLQELIQEQVDDPDIQQVILEQTAGILQMRFLIADVIVLVTVIVIGYLLTKATLRPIRQALDRERRFIADAAHELRTPLAVMKTEIEVTLREKATTAESAKKVLSSAVEEIDNLTHIANGLIEIVRGQTKEIGAERFSALDMMETVVAKLRPLAQAKHIAIIEQPGEDRPVMRGDRAMLSGALYNIVHNAIAYTPEKGTVTISLRTKGADCEVAVADTGIGIGQKDIPHIFDPFYRSDASHSAAGGAGLGLAIAKTAVEKHGGKIVAESTPGKGTRMIITLPMR